MRPTIPPSSPIPTFKSMKLYTNYDGAKHGFGTLSVSDRSSANPDLFASYAALDATGTTMTIMVLNKDPGNTANVTFNLNGFSATTYTAYTLASTNPGSITTSASAAWSATQSFAALQHHAAGGQRNPDLQARLGVVFESGRSDDSGLGHGDSESEDHERHGHRDTELGGLRCLRGRHGVQRFAHADRPTITPTTPATITVNTSSTPGFCHYTVTGSDGDVHPDTGRMDRGRQARRHACLSGRQPIRQRRNGSAAAALTVTLSSIPSGTSRNTGAGILFTTSAGTLSNGDDSGTSVIAHTNASGNASVTLTLPSTQGTVTVTAQDQFALGGASVTFTETAK